MRATRRWGGSLGKKKDVRKAGGGWLTRGGGDKKAAAVGWYQIRNSIVRLPHHASELSVRLSPPLQCQLYEGRAFILFPAASCDQ